MRKRVGGTALAGTGAGVALAKDGERASPYRPVARETVSLGNVGVPVWAGRMVGGSTTINSGTCYRLPERTFQRWRDQHGLPGEFSSQGFDGYFQKVEAMLQVEREIGRAHV